MQLIENFWSLFMDAALWLCVGLVLAGMIKAWLPAQLMQRHLGRPGSGAVIKGALIGAPLPLCSCGVLPVAMSLRRSGASRGATVSFLVATPETGVDSVTVSYALLGPFLTIVRPIAAICSAIVAGLMAGVQDTQNTTVAKSDATEARPIKSSCCGSQKAAAKDTAASCHSEPVTEKKSCCGSEKPPVEKTSSCCGTTQAESSTQSTDCHSAATPEPTESHGSCCGSKKAATAAPKANGCCASKTVESSHHDSKWQQLKGGLHYAFNDILDGITLWLLAGLFFAALMTTYVDPAFMAEWGHGPIAMLAVILLGIPMYICATASTPIAAGLLLSGVSPGTVLVFMMAGPATNIAAVGLVKRELGLRALVGYLSGVALVAIAFGMGVDYWVVAHGIDIQAQIQHSEHLLPPVIFWIAAFVLVALMIKPIRQRVLR